MFFVIIPRTLWGAWCQGSNIVADVEDNDVVVYFRGINLIYADDGDKTYYHFNAHGDVVVLTNESGTKTKSYSYNAFGVEYNEATLDDNPFRYCGEYYDKETKTIYLRARYYDSARGRFTQEDTHWNVSNMIYGDDPDNTVPDQSAIIQSGNLYVYCSGNPVNLVDRTGENEAALVLDIWMKIMSLIASIEPTVVGEAILVVGAAIIGGVIISEYVIDYIDDISNEIVSFLSQLSEKAKTEADPYARPGQKKQGRERKNKARQKKDWKPKSNPKPPKKHTPGRDHRKYK